MPTYEYVCNGCGHEFEQFQSMKDDSLKKCPECKKDKLKRKIGTGAGIIFKGTGFYCTDFKNNGCSPTSKRTESAPETRSETKSEPAKAAASSTTASSPSDAKSN